MSLVVDAPDRKRYEAEMDGALAGFLDYVIKHDRIALIHTEVPPAFAGHGVAANLTRFALDEARRRGLKVIAICPYVRSYLEKHPEDHDIVVGMSAGQGDRGKTG
jgi:predicted GNAT family acetyltransferase